MHERQGTRWEMSFKCFIAKNVRHHVLCLCLLFWQENVIVHDIFNPFVQRSLAHWDEKQIREKGKWARRRKSRHGSACVSGGVWCVAGIDGSAYVWNMTGHSSRHSSVCSSRRISMGHSGDPSHCTSPSSTHASHSKEASVWASGCAKIVYSNAAWRQTLEMS